MKGILLLCLLLICSAIFRWMSLSNRSTVASPKTLSETASKTAIVTPKAKVAFILRGGISQKGAAHRNVTPNNEQGKAAYINYRAVANNIKRHIFEPNADQYDFDTYIQCWNTDLKEDLEEIYKPVKSLFEENSRFKEQIQRAAEKCIDYQPNCFPGTSQALAIKHALSLVDLDKYDRVILFRPDVIITKDLLLKNYDADKMYANNWFDSANGDFHFIMGPQDAKRFAGLFDSALQGNPQMQHEWIRLYVEKFMKKTLYADDIKIEVDENVVRPDRLKALSNYTDITKYGFVANDLTED